MKESIHSGHRKRVREKFLTNEFEQSESNYDDETVRYIRLTHKVNMALTEIADKLYEYGNGGFVIK